MEKLDKSSNKNKKVIVIDNYDSFTYNLVHVIEEILEHEITVKKNDEVLLEELVGYDYIFLSPGPGLPEEAGLLKDIISRYRESKKILGICLGLQAIAEVYEANLYNLPKVYHGIQSEVSISEDSILYDGIESPLLAGRYHSWVMSKDSLPDGLIITGMSREKHIMSIEHKTHKVYAVQYHPESYITPKGKKIIENFLAKA
jgi:anthranilate synthase component 2